MNGENRSRGAGRRQVLAALGDHGPASRVDLGRRTGLSSSAISAVSQDLIAEGLVRERPAAVAEGQERRGRGRPAYLLSLVPPAGIVAGVDIGNTHVRVAVAAVGAAVLAERAATLGGADRPEDTIRRAAELTREVVTAAGRRLDELRLAVVGVPVPLEESSGRVADNNILPLWVGRRPGAELGELLGVQVVVDNDANLGALGEQRHGVDAASPQGSLVYLKLATGIGAGLVLDGRLFRGAGGTAGEIGHVQVDPSGVLCRCGSRGCLETVVSLPRLLGSLAPVTRDDLDADGLGDLVRDGHPGAVRVVADAGRRIGEVLASLVTVLNPGALVVGGHVGPLNALLAEHVRAAVEHGAQPAAAARVVVRASVLDDRAEVLGALAHASDVLVAEQRARVAL
ncbi:MULTISPECIES: ROK family transcriptional regulator [Nocardioides]|uniref:Sugar kinase of the NBD/HSP70 family, may contain an N-terminal HTH domain n=1 Tax=Nocardioides lianchengensis TaxID=1045774 RepID=A0A1G7A9W1_9ACTN|nr:ROK family transcriptional regulator [Nocardioides lianchengensis]NYG13661.1 putative NBD/HSP70 family sugar kinase [Nocardioides lianchengensis]SDE11599.1 Sugar kinase of the NBD/HSP70 family, may contain an N-terminal HTH domain [Nocardioides lianchengensis]